ncbi:MAG: hypothetical protein MUF48_17220 [Pirellulaceae bacterium]|nr:hypothetical protein [Pirellulaceae bacterium]
MNRHTSVGWMTLVLVVLVGPLVVGADESAAELYGRGIHAYFSGDYALAAELMSQSIAKLPTDPRAYYFRGLAYANLGGVEAGLSDFQQGADVEYNTAERPIVDINGALQRVQGVLRLELEKVRAATLQAAVERKKQRDRVRYEELKRREDVVLFDPKRPAAPLDVELPKPDLGGKPDPFASGLAFSGGKPVEVATPSPVPGTEPGAADQPRDPFATPTQEEAAPSAPEDPFATPVAKPAASPMKPDAKPAAEAANPFGENLPKLELEYEDEPPSPVMQAAGSVISVLGKAMSSQAADRDPFAPPKKKAEAEAPPANEPSQPAADAAKGDDPFAPANPPAPGTDTGPASAPPAPAESGKTPADAPAQKPADPSPTNQDDDPFK